MIADCVRSHIAWLRLNAEVDGETGGSATVDWAFVRAERTQHLLFPSAPEAADVRAAVERADALGAAATAFWSARDVRRPEVRDLGFEPGWQPWWMQVDPRRVRAAPDDRVRFVDAVQEHDAGRAAVVGRPEVLLAEAVDGGRYAGRAWLHLDGPVAGLYDMEVRPTLRRRGLGRALVGLLAEEAARRGAERITLNATPEGATLYAACGFRLLGAGRTWWRQGPARAG